MNKRLTTFRQYREKFNQVILDRDNINIKRFFGIDTAAYRAGALDARTKELLGLVASAVLRCDDCITYHLDRCREEGITDAEFDEAMTIVLVVGGSITIPHLRRAYESWTDAGEEQG